MAVGDKHAALLLALGAPKRLMKSGSGGGDDEAEDDTGDTDDDSDLGLAAAKDILDAVKERDAAALKDSLQRFVKNCMNEDGKDDESSS